MDHHTSGQSGGNIAAMARAAAAPKYRCRAWFMRRHVYSLGNRIM
jgi:hypothetical protein